MRFGDELVVQTAQEDLKRTANLRRRAIPAPDLTWVAEDERMRLLEECIACRAEFRVWLAAEMHAADCLPAELALSRAGKNGAAPKRQRRSSKELREQVLGLHDRGLVPAAIADTLNISERRVRAILRSGGYRQNGPQKRLVQAGKSAAKPVGHVAAWVSA